jgi:glycerate dehydrogenase
MAQLGDLTVYDRTPRDLIVEHASGAEIILSNKTVISDETMARLPDLRYIGVIATGYNVVDVEAAARRGIVITNAPAYSTDSVAQMVFALLLELCNHVCKHSEAVRSGEWVKSKDFAFWKNPQIELSGKTMGIIGFGSIGRRVARIASTFGMNVVVSSRTRPDDLGDASWVEMPELLRQSDVVSLHCPLTDETSGLIDRETLDLMKPSAFLINTARGPLVVDSDLAEALNEGRIAGAGLDVLTNEPPKAENPLLSAKNCAITPHIAWATVEARSRLMQIIVENVRAFIEGRPINVIPELRIL